MTDKKFSHADVHYRITASLARRCGTCKMYIERMPPACTIVDPPIKPGAVCDQWEEQGKRRR